MATRNINGRLALDRVGVAERAGAALPTVDRWNGGRPDNGFPAPLPAQTTGEPTRRWWWAEDVDAFLSAQQAAKQSRLTAVDRSGDSDDLLTAAEIRRVLGYRSHKLPDALLAIADEVEEKPGKRPRRRWRRSTVWAFADQRGTRRGGGPPTGTRNAVGTRALDPTGDPDELVGSTEAARVLGYAANTSLPTELYELADETEAKPSGRTWHRWRRRTLWDFNDRPGGATR